MTLNIMFSVVQIQDSKVLEESQNILHFIKGNLKDVNM